ncbi:hypothetical protein DFS34DRAFT_620141 [Phlyctochytrium arcticum]|nr:hypothetical protein DFS34DRAFT_620141 [Phlyctochytrium arcticum]
MRAVDIPSLAFNAVGVSNHGIQQMPVAEFATVMKSLVTILLKSMPLDKEKRYQAAVDILFSSMGCKTAWELGAKNIHGKGNNKTRADLGISGEPNTLDATVEVKCAITTRGSGETQFRAAFAQNSAATHLLHYQHVIQPRLKDFIRTLSRPVRPDTPAEVLAGQAKFLLRESLNGQTVDMFIVIGYYITGFRVLATSILDDLHLGDHGMPFLSILPYTLDPKGWLHILDDADTIHIRLLAAGVKGVLPLSLEWLHTLERAALRGGLDGFQKCLAERDLGRIY